MYEYGQRTHMSAQTLMALCAVDCDTKRRMARLVSPMELGFSRPAADFATAGKLYLETTKRSKPEKGAVC
jgi:hypothetical protein